MELECILRAQNITLVDLFRTYQSHNRLVWIGRPLTTSIAELISEEHKQAYLYNIIFIIISNGTHLSWLSFYYRLSSNGEIEWFRNTLHISVVGIMSLFAVYLSLLIRLCQ